MEPVALESPTEAKARGAFYTPQPITRFLAAWAIRGRDDQILEPACGDGAFIQSIEARLADLGSDDLTERVVGIERAPDEARKVMALAPTARVLAADFFDIEPSSLPTMDVVIGNPPYIRYHAFSGRDREKGLLRAASQGVGLSGLASSWAHFVVHSVAFLGSAGRLALVLPAELLHTDYGQPVRELLLRRFSSIIVVAFDRAVFSDAQVDAVLLLASTDDVHGLRMIRIADATALDGLDLRAGLGYVPSVPSRRWSSALDADAASLYSDARIAGTALALGALSTVDIGFVSGADDFFILAQEEATRRHLPLDVLVPAIRRPRDIPGLIASDGELRWLLDLSHRSPPTDEHLLEYLREGEAVGIAERYKCRVRRPWYAVPRPRSRPDAFLPYMSQFGPRLIVNDVGAWSSNLLHGLTVGLLGPDARTLATAMASSLTLLSAEIEGRAYGGGVLKLETKEAEQLLVPVASEMQRRALAAAFSDVHTLIRARDLEGAARVADSAAGLDHEPLWAAYLTFRNRRLGRRRPQPCFVIGSLRAS